MAMKAKAVFVDKDGTLVENVPFNCDPDQIRLLPTVIEGMLALQKAGYQLVVVSNQPGVALGRFKIRALKVLEARLNELLGRCGVAIAAYAWCPHHPDGIRPPYARRCACRKPAPGMLLDAKRRLNLDLETSWMIGDILDDVEAGTRAGCRTVLVERGSKTEWEAGPFRSPTAIVETFAEAADVIVHLGGHRAARAFADGALVP